LTSRTKDGEKKWKWNSNVQQDANVQYYSTRNLLSIKISEQQRRIGEETVGVAKG
jgi:hypothetical protein